MSMLFTAFSCDACGFKAGSTAVWGRYNYRTPDGDVPLQRKLGWCCACADVIAMEVLPGPQRTQALEQEVAQRTAYVRDYVANAEKGRGTLARLLNRPVTVPEEVREVDHLRTIAESELKAELARIRLLSGRTSGPRCLVCGSVDVEAIPEAFNLQGSYRDPGPPVRIGWKHPGCGGEIMAAHSGIRIGMRMRERWYDAEGRLLSPRAAG